MYAISSAGVAFAVTRACSSGELEKCGCDRTVHGVSPQGKCRRWGGPGRGRGRGPGPHSPADPACPPHPGFQWSGCSDNIAYGVAFSQSFVDVRERSKGASSSRALMNLHNNEAGRKVVRTAPAPSRPAGKGWARQRPQTLSPAHLPLRKHLLGSGRYQAPPMGRGARGGSGQVSGRHRTV